MWIYIIATIALYFLFDYLLRLPTVGKYGERHVFITGCDTGFGNLLAKRLDSLGFHVFAGCFTERGADQLRKVSSGRLKTIDVDVTKPVSIRKCKEFVEKHLPENEGLWAVVNNAGVTGNVAPSELLTSEDYDKCLSVNLFGVISVTRVFQSLVRRGRGRFINTSSVMGRIAAAGAPYVISKYGIEAFSDVLRKEIRMQGMTVHIITPGFFKTELNTMYDFSKEYKRRLNEADPELLTYYGHYYSDQEMTRIHAAIDKFTSPELSLVVDAYTHAITAMFPRYRYLAGNDAKYYFRLLWNLPEWISDYLLTSGVTLPQGELTR